MPNVKRPLAAPLFAAALTAVLSLGFASEPAHAQSQWEKVQIKSTPVAGSVHMLKGRGGNIAVSVGEDGVFMVDDQFAPLTGKIQAAVAELTDKPIRFVINTHHHGDHTGGNENLGKAGATIVAHDNVRLRLAKNKKNGGLPELTFNDQISFHLNGERVRAWKVPPAHTDGDVFVYFEGSDVLHMGDTFFNGLYTFFDATAGGSFDGMLKALKIGLDTAGPDTKIIPGHGGLATKADLKAHYDRLIQMRDVIAKAIDAGTSLSDFAAGNPLAEIEASYSGSYKVLPARDFIKFAYTSLKTHK